MAGWFVTDNPWTQEPDDARRAAIGRVLRAEKAARAAAAQHTALRATLTTFADRCLAIAGHWDREPGHYRAHRRFAAVDVVDLEKLCTALTQTTVAPNDATVRAIGEAMDRAQPVAVDTGTSQGVANALDSLGIAITTDAQDAPQPGMLGKAWGGIGALAGAGKTMATQVGRKSLDGAGAGVDWALAGAQETFHRTVTPVRAIVGGFTHAFSAGSLTEAVWNMGGWGVLASIICPPALPVVLGLSLMDTVLENATEESGRIEREGGAAAQRAAERRQKATRTLLQAAGMASEGPQVFSTPYVHTVVDGASGSITVRILEGRYAGYDLAELDNAARQSLLRTAPDADTKAVLAKIIR